MRFLLDGGTPLSNKQFSIRTGLSVILLIGLIIGWLTDRSRQAKQFAARQAELELETQRHKQTAEQLSQWYASNHSMEGMPISLRDAVEQSTAEVVAPQSGYRLLRSRNAHLTLAYVGLTGASYRIRGGPLKYELVAEDLSGPTPKEIYRLEGPVNPNEPDLQSLRNPENTDGVLTYCRPTHIFAPMRRNQQRECTTDPYRICFVQGPFSTIEVPAHELWPEWIYDGNIPAPRLNTTGTHDRVAQMQPDKWLTMYTQELTASDGRKARVQFRLKCEEQIRQD